MDQYEEDSLPEDKDPLVPPPLAFVPLAPENERNLKTLFKDKRVLLAVPLFLLGFGGVVYYIVGKNSPDQPVQQMVSPLNTAVPMASIDSTSSGKLRLQEDAMTLDMNPADPTASMQDGLPQETIDPYLYGDKRRVTRQSSDRNIRRVDSAIYARNSSTLQSPTPARNYAGRNGGSYNRETLPGTLQPGRASTSSAPGFLREQDAMLAPDGPERAPISPEQGYAQGVELQKTVAKQKRLMTLLEKYNADKEQQKLIDQDKKVVRKPEEAPLVGSLSPEPVRGGGSANTFFGLYTEDKKKQQRRQLDEEVGTIRAMVYGDQQVVSNGRVKIRLLEPITVRSVVIPAGSIIYGIGSFGTERVTIKLNSIQYEDRIFPVSLTAYDMDGMVGIYVPNVQGQTETRQALVQGANGFNINTASGFNTSALAAAGSAGAQAVIQGARQFVQKKAAQQKASLKNNYYILLRSGSDNDRTQDVPGRSEGRMPATPSMPVIPGMPDLSSLPGIPTGYTPR